LGCGSGRHVVYLAKNGFEVYGIDIAKSGIKIAKEWLKDEKLKANLKAEIFTRNFHTKTISLMR
jgi:2-polyprenyl-3-methyl-5-hydroxy-6-metoxy-1,4-benzoquinol methylase